MSDCLFCKIVAGEIPATIVSQDEEWVAFRDVHPQAPVHILVIPRKHVASMNEFDDADVSLLGRMLLAARQVAEQEGIAAGYRLVNNCGGEAGQTVLHWHLHLLGGRMMNWPPG